MMRRRAGSVVVISVAALLLVGGGCTTGGGGGGGYTPGDTTDDAVDTGDEGDAPDTSGVDADAGADSTAPDASDAADGADAGPDLPPAICTAGTRWTPGTAIFVERTADWGLEAAGVQGTRLNLVDYDGDGRIDLMVRRGGTVIDDLSPGGKRNTWLLRNGAAKDGPFFTDVSVEAGLLTTRQSYDDPVGRPGQIYAAADVDNDGDLDLYSGLETWDPANSLSETSEILLNTGDGAFLLGPEDSPLRRAGAPDVPAGASFVDYDRDGNVDIWVPQHNYTPPGTSSLIFMQDRLYRGDGTGRFDDVTTPSNLTTADWQLISTLNAGKAHSRAWSSTACDLNGDGVTELLAASYGRAPNHLWQGVWHDGGVPTFLNRSVDSGYAYDDDFTWQDNQFAECYCKANPGAEGCAGVAAPLIGCGQINWNHSQDREPFRLGGNSGATVCADVDNDGDIDLLTTEIRHWWAGSGADGSELLINDGQPDPTFDRPGDEALGLAVPHPEVSWDEGHMTADIFDFDNDGWGDVYIGASDYAGNRGLLYHNDGGDTLAFTEVPTADFFEHNRSHGVAVADFDGDGDLDIVVGHSRARCDSTMPNDCYPTTQVRIFENVLGDGGNWLQLDLEGAPGTNRAAIGARITVVTAETSQTREIGGGYGHYGAQDDTVAHFGLGTACEAEVTVRWPDFSLSEETYRLVAGYRYHWRQGEGPSVAP